MACPFSAPTWPFRQFAVGFFMEGGWGVPRWQNWQWLEKRGSGGGGGVARDDIYI